MSKLDVHQVFVRRLKAARKAVGLSQANLGLRMGLPGETASTRINRYELGVSEPNLRTAEQVADALGVPLSWLVCTDARLAKMIHGFARLKPEVQKAWLEELEAALKVKENLAPPKVERAKKTKRAPRVKL